MADTKHTPGPWVDDGQGIIYGDPRGDGDETPFVADVSRAGGFYTDEEKANARVIVAALKMRDALDYVEMELSAFKPDALKKLGLDVAFERIRDALTAAGHDVTKEAMPEGKPGLADEITLGWSIQDVHELRPDLSKEQCREVLHRVEKQHNADIGITWNTIEDAAEDLFPAPDSPPPAAPAEAKPFDLVGSIIAYESGELDQAGTVELFQHLVDTGMAWQLQGSIGRTARDMIEAGLVEPPAAADKPTPSITETILRNPRAFLPEPGNGNDHGHGNDGGQVRGR